MDARTLATALIALTLVGVLAVQLLRPRWRDWQRRRLRAKPLPSAWREILERNVALYALVPLPIRERLDGFVNVFVSEKRFIGCNGLPMTDEIKVTIAAQACFLIVNRDAGCFDTLTTVLVYPRAFYVDRDAVDDVGVIHETRKILVGESWDLGRVVVSWDDAREGGRHASDGMNVVMHEFAHQLDGESGDVNGAPWLGSGEEYSVWADTMVEEFEALVRRLGRGVDSLIDPYAATHPAEFFAVTTETFFEDALNLRQQHSSLYQRLREFYRLDPAVWMEHRL